MSLSPSSSPASDRLAIDGGTPVRTAPFPTRHLFGEAEKGAVVALFDRAIAEGSHLLGYGGEQERGYTEAFAAWLGGGFADGVNSGTTAVYVALRALDPPPHSEIIVPPITDPGGIMPIALMNCIPVPADAAPGSYNAGAEQIAARLTSRTSAIIVAHIAGHPVDLDPILALARSKGLPVVEDCAQSHGATYRGRITGTFGDTAAFSTMFGKHHATGGQGGVVFTRDQALAWRVRQVADRGKPFGVTGAQGNVSASLNFNMDELHAAIGRVQLARLPEFLATRRRLAARLDAGCRDACRAVRLHQPLEHAESAWWFFLLTLDLEQFRVPRARLVEALQKEGIPVNPGYFHVAPNHDWYNQHRVFGSGELPWSAVPDAPTLTLADLPNARATDERHLMLGLHEGYGDREIDDIVAALAKIERAYAI